MHNIHHHYSFIPPSSKHTPTNSDVSIKKINKEKKGQSGHRCQAQFSTPFSPYAQTPLTHTPKKVCFTLAKRQKIGRTRDRTGITGIRIRCANHYTIQPLMEGMLAVCQYNTCLYPNLTNFHDLMLMCTVHSMQIERRWSCIRSLYYMLLGGHC